MFDAWSDWGGNNDGVLDSQDSVWNELKVWQNIDQDSEVDAGELKTLSDLGITKIDLEYDDGTEFADVSTDVPLFGSTLLGQASYYKGEEKIVGGIGDVALAHDAEGWRKVEIIDPISGDVTGYRIEFESGEHMDLTESAQRVSANVDLTTENTYDANGNITGAENGVTLDLEANGFEAAYSGDGDDTLTISATHSEAVSLNGGLGDVTRSHRVQRMTRFLATRVRNVCPAHRPGLYPAARIPRERQCRDWHCPVNIWQVLPISMTSSCPRTHPAFG